MATPHDADALISRERNLIADLGIEPLTRRFQRVGRGGTQSNASFRYALSMPEASLALAILRAYISAVGLARSENLSVSAMPSWAGPRRSQRFATVNGTRIELFSVEFEPASGRVTEWGARFPESRAPRVSDPDRVWQSTADNGDIVVHGAALDDLLIVLEDPDFRAALIATRVARATSHRADRQNPYLGALLGASDSPFDAETEPVTDRDIEFERRYIDRVTRSRLHQAPLRNAALRHYSPAACAYCGLDVLEVLDVAHIEPDSAGGAASVDNVRLLCANHHRAFDRVLLTWESQSDRFVRTRDAPNVPPSPAR